MLITEKYDYDVAIQLIIKGSEFESFIKFRDALLNDSNLVEKYNSIKLEYSNNTEDEYRVLKSKFITEILNQLCS